MGDDEREGAQRQKDGEHKTRGASGYEATCASSAASGAVAAGRRAVRGEHERLWTGPFLIVLLATLCCYLVGQGANAGTSVYVARMGGTATLAGIGAAAFSAAAAISRLFSGPLIDKRGRALVMAAGTVLLLAGTAGPLTANDGALFVVWRCLQGAGFAVATTASATAAADVLPQARLGEGIGYYGLGQALAMSFGPALALFLVSTDPAENLYLGLSAAAAVALVFAVACHYEKHPEKLPATSAFRKRCEAAGESEEKVASRKCTGVGTDGGANANADAGAGACGSADAGAGSDVDTNGATASKDRTSSNICTASSPDQAKPTCGCTPSKTCAHGRTPAFASLRRLLSHVFEVRALPGTVPMLVLSPAFGFSIFFMGLYGSSIGVGNAGLYYTVSAVSMILVRLRSRAFMDKAAAISIMTAAVASGLAAYGLLLACGMLDLGAATSPVFYLAGIAYGLCLGIAIPINQTVAIRNTPAARWGAANALYQLATDLGIGVSTVIWGAIADSFGFSAALCCVMVCIAASLLLAHLSYPASEKRPHSA